jgi:hypothetical protein
MLIMKRTLCLKMHIYIFGPPNRDIFLSFMYTRIRPKVERFLTLNFVTNVIEVTLDSLKIQAQSIFNLTVLMQFK